MGIETQSLQSDNIAFERNLGFITSEEQRVLINSTVAIAGAGGDGGMLAVQLARMGVGNFKLADPDPFEEENLNRQAACTQSTIGINKAVAVGDYIREINPKINVEIYREGISRDNTDEFLSGSDLLIDETEFTIHSLGVMLARSARRKSIPNLMAMNVGFGATVTSFVPDGKTFEEFLGLKISDNLEKIDQASVAISRWVPYLPPYVDLAAFQKVASGEKSAPSVAPGVAIAAGTAAVQAMLHLLGGENNRPDPVIAPKVLSIDAYTGKSKLIKHPLLSHYKSLARVIVNNKLNRNPKTSY